MHIELIINALRELDNIAQRDIISYLDNNNIDYEDCGNDASVLLAFCWDLKEKGIVDLKDFYELEMDVKRD